MKQTTFNYITLGLFALIIIDVGVLIYLQLTQTKQPTKAEMLIGYQKILTEQLEKIPIDTTLNKTIYLIKESEKAQDIWITKLDSTQTDSILYSLAKEFERSLEWLTIPQD